MHILTRSAGWFFVSVLSATLDNPIPTPPTSISVLTQRDNTTVHFPQPSTHARLLCASHSNRSNISMSTASEQHTATQQGANSSSNQTPRLLQQCHAQDMYVHSIMLGCSPMPGSSITTSQLCNLMSAGAEGVQSIPHDALGPPKKHQQKEHRPAECCGCNLEKIMGAAACGKWPAKQQQDTLHVLCA